MTREDIITSLKDQARDKDNLAGGDPDSIFTHDAAVLREAADALRAKQSHAKLYDNDAYFDEFKDGVYDLLADDPTWDRANQIIDLFLSAPEVETVPVDDITIDHTKLDRSRWEGCRFCKGDLEGYTTEFKDVNGKQRRLFIPEGKAMIVAPGKYNYKLCIPIKYCPFCSCPLTEEAWADLERRINHES